MTERKSLSLFERLCEAGIEEDVNSHSVRLALHFGEDAQGNGGEHLDMGKIELSHDTTQSMLDAVTHPRNRHALEAVRLIHALPRMARALDEARDALLAARDRDRGHVDTEDETESALRECDEAILYINTGSTFNLKDEEDGETK